jgi:DNA-binding CsgD family transcriptional regulator
VLRGLLRYLSIGLGPQPLHARLVQQAEVVEEWLGIATIDGRVVSAPPDWSRLVRLLAMGEVAPRTAREQQRIVTEFLRRIVARLCAPIGTTLDHVDAQHDSPWGRFRIRVYRLPDAQARRADHVGVLIGRKEPRALALARGTGATGLSPQQREVAILLAGGKSNQEIAQSLDLTLNTASYHVKQVFARLQVHNRDEVAEVLLRLAYEGIPAGRGREGDGED